MLAVKKDKVYTLLLKPLPMVNFRQLILSISVETQLFTISLLPQSMKYARLFSIKKGWLVPENVANSQKFF
jgi:hypothetical protein